MHERFKRILIAATLGLFVALASNRIGQEFARLAIHQESTALDDLIIGSVAGLCAYGWASLLAERHSRQTLVARLKQEGALSERNRIARDIHDTLAQGFAGVIVNLEAAGELLGENREARKLCERALRIGRESLMEARSLLRGLRPLSLENGSLRHAVEHLVETVTDGTGLRTNCFVDEISNTPSIDNETQLLQIIREALTNVVKHAHANEVRVTVHASGGQIQLCVEDDGRGFDLGHAHGRAGFGLTTMRERAKELGGLLWVYTQPNQGTQIACFLPIPGELDARTKPCEIAVPSESSSLMTILSSAKD